MHRDTCTDDPQKALNCTRSSPLDPELREARALSLIPVQIVAPPPSPFETAARTCAWCFRETWMKLVPGSHSAAPRTPSWSTCPCQPHYSIPVSNHVYAGTSLRARAGYPPHLTAPRDSRRRSPGGRRTRGVCSVATSSGPLCPTVWEGVRSGTRCRVGRFGLSNTTRIY